MTNIEATPNQSADLEPNTAAPRAVDWENPRVAAILSAAAKCFARKGFTATTLAEIGKELGLRKSIVHYYFASKAALIHEVQSYSYHKYLDRVKEAIRGSSDAPVARAKTALKSLWEVVETNTVGTGLNIEVWSAARRDPELKRRAAALQHDARQLVSDAVGDVLGVSAADFPQMEALSTLILATINGLSVADYLEGDDVKAKEAYGLFLHLLKLGTKEIEELRGAPAAK